MSAERLEALCNRLEAALSRIERCGGAGGAGAAAEGGEATARICKSVFFFSLRNVAYCLFICLHLLEPAAFVEAYDEVGCCACLFLSRVVPRLFFDHSFLYFQCRSFRTKSPPLCPCPSRSAVMCRLRLVY